jgi:hypothetical protein
MVKCADCGYLAVRNVESRELEEAEQKFREKGLLPMAGGEIGRPHERHERMPLCFMGNVSLYEECRKRTSNVDPEPVFVILMMDDERVCSDFTKWKLGFTPKEHQVMIDRQRLQEWQIKQEASNRRWHWVELAILVIGAGLFTLLGAFIARGS